MKILAFTDTHGNKKYISLILHKAKKADIIICAGDLTLFGTGFFKLVKRFNKTDKKLLIIPGNHEPAREIESLRLKNIINLHKKILQINDYIFIGHGEGGFSYTSREFEAFSREVIKKLKNKKIIFITHQPPFNTKLDFIRGMGHMGNKSYRKFINKTKPILVISGHLHENFNKTEKTKHSFFINPGPKGQILKI